jgi:hypothetical protein
MQEEEEEDDGEDNDDAACWDLEFGVQYELFFWDFRCR